MILWLVLEDEDKEKLHTAPISFILSPIPLSETKKGEQ